MADGQTVASEIPALKSLRRLFAKAIGLARLDSAWQAHTGIQAAETARAKQTVLEARFDDWKNGSVSAIREYFPQFVALGSAFSERLQTSPVEWAEEECWRLLIQQCGAARPGGSNGIPKDDRRHPAKWWLAVAVSGNADVFLPTAKPFCAPEWAKAGRISLDGLFSIQTILGSCFHGVIDEEKERAHVRFAFEGLTKEPLAAPGSSADRKRKSGRKPTRNSEFDAIAAKLWNTKRSGKGRVSAEGLKEIAAELDKLKFSNPADHLEGSGKQNLNTHNRNFGHSRKKIMSWSDLVERGDKFQMRAMRRLLSRCASNVRK